MPEVMHRCRMGLTWPWLLSSLCHHTAIVRSVHSSSNTKQIGDKLPGTMLVFITVAKLALWLSTPPAWPFWVRIYNPCENMEAPWGGGGQGEGFAKDNLHRSACLACVPVSAITSLHTAACADLMVMDLRLVVSMVMLKLLGRFNDITMTMRFARLAVRRLMMACTHMST